MTVFRTFFKIASKYIASFIMYSAIFLGIVTLIAMNGKSQSTTDFVAAGVKTVVFDHDESRLSQGLTDYLAQNHQMITIDEDIDIFRDKIYNREVGYILTIPKGYEKSVLEGTSDTVLEVYMLPGSISGQFMDMAVNTFVSTYCGYLVSGFDAEEAYENTMTTIDVKADVTFASGKVETEYDEVHSFYIYLPYALISVIILSVGPVLIVYNKEEIKTRISCSRVSNVKKNLSLIAGCGVCSLLIISIYVLASLLLYPGKVLDDVFIYRLLNLLVHTFVCVSFAFLFSVLTRTSNLLNMFSNVLGLGSSFLCGIFVPRYWLSDGVNAVGHFLPAYWYVNVEEAVSDIEHAAMSTITMGYVVQLLYGIAVLVIAMILSQYRKKR